MRVVLVYEPETLIAEAILVHLSEGVETRIASDLTQLAQELAERLPSLLLLPHRPPELDALSLMKTHDAHLAPAQVLMVAHSLSKPDLCSALELNIGGILTSRATPDLLRTAVNAILEGSRYIQPELIQQALKQK